MMALAFKCEKGHSYVAPDLLPDDWPEGAPICPECRKEWERARAYKGMLLKQQQAYYNATERKDLVILQGGAGSGKTYAAMAAAVEKCANTEGYTVFYWALISDCDYSFSKWARDPRVKSANGATKTLMFSNGSKVVLCHTPEYSLGLDVDWLIIDLFGQIPVHSLLKLCDHVTIILGEDWEVIKMPEVENLEMEGTNGSHTATDVS